MARRNKKTNGAVKTSDNGKVKVKALTPGQKKYITEIRNNRIVFCTGPAGTGKTAVATGLALESILAAHPAYKKLVIMRPVREACGESLGYLPGNLDEKNSTKLIDLFKRINRDFNMTIMLTTHNPSIAKVGKKVYELKSGELIKK